MEILIIFFLTVLNGILAMSEAAVISASKPRLRHQIDAGDEKAEIALELVDNPNRFLSTVQIGISLIGILAGAFGGATIANDLAATLSEIELLAPYSQPLGFFLVVLLTTYLSLVIGELVPKRLAIQFPERISSLIAPAMQRLSMLAYPLVWFLGLSTNTVLRLLGVSPEPEETFTEEEIDVMIREGARTGTIATSEQQMVAGVFRLDDLRADSLMTPRTEMIWLNVDDPPEEIRRILSEYDYSRYPVCEGTPDNVIGIVRAKDILRCVLAGEQIDLHELALEPIFVPETLAAADVLERFRGRQHQIAFVIGEYGGTEGLITINDIMEAVLGDLEEPEAVRRDDGSWLVDGLMPIEEFREVIGMKRWPDDDEEMPYRTLAGFFINHQGHIPEPAEQFEWNGYSFEVVDMDSKRVDKILVRRLQNDEPDD